MRQTSRHAATVSFGKSEANDGTRVATDLVMASPKPASLAIWTIRLTLMMAIVSQVLALKGMPVASQTLWLLATATISVGPHPVALRQTARPGVYAAPAL